MDCKEFEAFCVAHGDAVAEDICQRITEAMCDRDNASRWGVQIDVFHQHNACNHTASGCIDFNGGSFGFCADSGDHNGFVMREWGDAEDVGMYQPPKPVLWTFIPKDPGLEFSRPALFRAYLMWRKDPWFKDKESGLNYDRHFAPGSKTMKYYTDWADKKGMKPAPMPEDENYFSDRMKRTDAEWAEMAMQARNNSATSALSEE